jgi:hypothetical protein
MLKHLSRLSEKQKALLFLISISALLKVTLALSVKVINPDADDFILAAQQFAFGHFGEGLALSPVPFFPLLITFFHFFVPGWITAARVATVLPLVLALIPLYLLTHELFGRRPAFWASLLFALAPFPNECATEVIRGPVFLLFLAWAVYFGLRAIVSTGPGSYLMAALFAWLSILFRVEGIIYIPFFLAFLVILAFRRPEERAPFLRGIALWVAFPLFFFAVSLAFIGPEAASLVRFDDVSQPLKRLFQLRFLENYCAVYDRLKALEALAAYPSGKQNFAEIARHFMPLIYLLGLLQSLVKVIFPLYVIPLFWGFRHSLDRRRVFVLSLIGLYLLMVYYRLIQKDFVQDRFLLAPAFFLYPWIGAGTVKIVTTLKQFRRGRLLIGLMVITMVLPALYKSAGPVFKQDNVIRIAGEWLADRKELQEARIITNDSRIPFYAGRGNDFLRFNERDHAQSYGAMEEIARANRSDLIIIRVSSKKKGRIPDFPQFKKTQEFLGKKNIAVIYASPEFHRRLGRER